MSFKVKIIKTPDAAETCRRTKQNVRIRGNDDNMTAVNQIFCLLGSIRTNDTTVFAL